MFGFQILHAIVPSSNPDFRNTIFFLYQMETVLETLSSFCILTRMLSSADQESSIPLSANPNAVLVTAMDMAKALLSKTRIEGKKCSKLCRE